MTVMTIKTGRLARLAEQVRAELYMLRYPDQPWVVGRRRDDGAHVYDVAIIGGGQGGLAIAARLKRERVDNVIVYDERPAGLEGPWLTTARMLTLRTMKHLPGIDATLPSLSPQAWYTARYGEEAWEAMDRIPKGDWQDYLNWCRATLDLPVRNQVRVTSVKPESGMFRLDLAPVDATGDIISTECSYARRVVLATGVDGGGAWHVPSFISDNLPRDRYYSSGEHIDFSRMVGKRVAVLGAGASAYDNASTSLEKGALSATVCIRRADVQRINPQMWMAKAGVLNHFADLPDDLKWQFMCHVYSCNIPAPQPAYERLSSLAGASIRTNAEWKSVRIVDDGHGEEIEVLTASGEKLRVDFLIVAIGFVQDFKLRPEMSNVVDDIALWRDRFSPPAGSVDAHVLAHPYLGPSFEFLEKTPGTAPHLSWMFNFTYSAFVSMGLSGSAISGFKYALPRLVDGITRSLFLEDAETMFEQFRSYGEPEMVGAVPFNNDVSRVG
jgi:cation diffusion facilitator CzcD-associated flavoprotein CzcO